METNGDSRLVDDNEVVVVGNVLDCHEITGLFGDIESLHSLSATVGNAVFFKL